MGVILATDNIDEGPMTITRRKAEVPMIYTVSQCAGTVRAAIKWDAIFNTPGLPIMGQFLGGVGVLAYMYVIQIDADVVDIDPNGTNSTCKVTIHFGQDPQANPGNPVLPSYSLSSVTKVFPTCVDKTGALITIAYTPSGSSTASTIVVTTGAEMVCDSITITRQVQGINPGAISDAITNTCNAKPWQGSPAGWWKCVDYVADSVDAMVTWREKYQFERAPLDVLGLDQNQNLVHKQIAWNKAEVYVAPDGTTPKDVSVGNGIIEVMTHDLFDFASMGI